MLRVIGNNQNLPRQEHAVASGTLPDGKPVVVNSDGTVSVVSETSVSQSVGSPTRYDTSSVPSTSATFDSNSNKVIIAYKDSTKGAAIVGTVSGTSISFGSQTVFQTGTIYEPTVTFDSNSNKVVVAYRNDENSNYGTAVVGTVSGTSISFGSKVVFNSARTNYSSATFDSNSNKVVIAYNDGGNSNYGTAIVGTVSGTSISFGSAAVFESASVDLPSAIFDSNSNKVVIAYIDDGNSSHGTAVVGTVSGNSISFGTPVVFESAHSDYVSATFDSNSNKIVIAYTDEGNSKYGTAIVGTVSGTSISFGSPVVFDSGSSTYGSQYMTATFDSNANKVVIGYMDGANSNYGTAIVGTVSGNSISFGSKVVFESAQTYQTASTFDSNSNRVVIMYRDGGASFSPGTCVVFRNASDDSNITSENYIGIAHSGAASGARAIIDTQGAIADNLSGLTAGQSYFVQGDGTLGTTAASPSVFAGTAVAATKLIVKG